MDVRVYRKLSSKEWARVIERYEARKGSVTLAAFAESEGLSYHTFQHKVYDERARRAGKLTSKQKSRARLRNDCCLVPVEVVSPVCPPVSERWLEADVPRGIRVRFTEGTDSLWLSRLLVGLSGGDGC